MPGYSVDLVGKSRFKEFYCSVCTLLLKDAIQLGDGKRICFSCYDENQHKRTNETMEYMMGMNGGPMSATSAEVIEKGYFPDRFARRVVSEIEVYCRFNRHGCEWVGPIKDFDKHVEACDKRPQLCPICGDAIPPSLIQQHMAEECHERIVNCKFCNEELKASSLESHDINCNRKPKTCEKCKMTLQPNQMTDHKQIWCHETTDVCPFKDEGCDHVEVMDKKGLLQHIKENLIYHILVLLGHVKMITRSLFDFQGKVSAMKDDIYKRIEKLSDSARNTQTNVMSWTECLKEQLQNQSIVVEETRKRTVDCEGALQKIIAHKEKYQEDLTDIRSRTVAHESQIQEQLAAIDHFQKQFNLISGKIDALRTAVYEVRKSQQNILGQTAKTDIQIPVYPPLDSNEYLVTHDGEMTWKISDVTRLRQEAILNKTRSFYSPPFFTSPAGFKCCGRLYMNGDGPAKGTHISLFFVVLKGPYDALQSWPFNKRIRLQLLNQDGGSHHEESFKPDLSSSSFARPTKDANIASGSPFFYSLNGLGNNGFLRDDVLFIRIKVDI